MNVSFIEGLLPLKSCCTPCLLLASKMYMLHTAQQPSAPFLCAKTFNSSCTNLIISGIMLSHWKRLQTTRPKWSLTLYYVISIWGANRTCHVLDTKLLKILNDDASTIMTSVFILEYSSGTLFVDYGTTTGLRMSIYPIKFIFPSAIIRRVLLIPSHIMTLPPCMNWLLWVISLATAHLLIFRLIWWNWQLDLSIPGSTLG